MDIGGNLFKPKDSFSGKLFVALLSVSFVFVSLTGLTSNYLYQSSIESEIQSISQVKQELLVEELAGLFSYLENTQTELMGSSVLENAVSTQDYSELLQYISRYTIGSLNVFLGSGEIVFSLSRKPGNTYSQDLEAVSRGMKLPISDLSKLQKNSTNIAIFENEKIVEIVRQRSFSFEKKKYILELVAPIRLSYFEKLSKQLGSYFYIGDGSRVLLSIPKSLKSYVGSNVLEDRSLVSYQGEKYSFGNTEILKDSLNLGGFVKVDGLVRSVGKLHFRIFLICLFTFLLLSPLLFLLSKKLTKPLTQVLSKTKDLDRKNTLNLLPVHSKDEFGKLVEFLNQLFTRINELEQESQARALENIVVHQKNTNLKSDYSKLMKDYLNSRMFRRNLEGLISGLNYSQSYSLNMNKLLSHFKELIDYLNETGQNQNFLRKHDLKKRIDETFGSGENVSSTTARQGELLIDQLWMMENLSSEDSLSLVASRCTRLFRLVFPSLHTKLDLAGIENFEIEKESFRQFLALLLFLTAKQSRDGNSLELKLEKVQDKQFQSFKAFSLQFDNPISFESSNLDSEGQTVLRMIEILSQELGWQILFPMKERAKVRKLYFQIELLLD